MGSNSKHAISAGTRSGLAGNYQSRFSQQLKADWTGPVAGATSNRLDVRLGSQWQLFHNDGLRLPPSYAHGGDEELHGLDLTWLHYF